MALGQRFETFGSTTGGNLMGFLGWAALGVGAYLLLKPRQSPPRPGPAAAVGDSIVAHPGFTAGLNKLRGYTWQNHGVVGNTTRSMLARADRWANPRFSEIVIMGNLNDMSPRLPPEWTIQNLRNLYRRAKAAGARVVAVTSTPWAGYTRWTPGEQADQNVVNGWILSGADGIPDVVVDAFHPLEDPQRPGHLRPEFAARDKLHLNRTGQVALTRAVIDQAYRGVPLVTEGMGDEPAAAEDPSDDLFGPLLIAAGVTLAGAAALGAWSGKQAAEEEKARWRGNPRLHPPGPAGVVPSYAYYDDGQDRLIVPGDSDWSAARHREYWRAA
jgi:hypothetical protein